MPPRVRKVAVMGLTAVGKSSLTIQYVDGQFPKSYNPTIENTFQKNVRVQGKDYLLQIVDTAGQDEYSIFTSNYSMNIDGYVLVYSVNSRRSFEVVKVIHDKLFDLAGRTHVPTVLVGNKTDLRMERVISREEGKRLSDSWQAAFFEASAKENQNVPDVFQSVIIETERERGEGNKQGKSSCLIS